LEASQVQKRIDAGMTSVVDWRLKQAWRANASAAQQLLKFCESNWIGGELATRAMNGAIRPLPVILNITFRPGHNFSIFLNR
jgi:hypothetical protein